MASAIVGIGGIEVADGQPLGVLGHEEPHLRDQILVGHPQAWREREDLEPVRRQVATLAQAERHVVEVGVIARSALDLEPEDTAIPDRLALLGGEAHERLPATILRRVDAEGAGRDLGPGRELLRRRVRPPAVSV